MADTNTKQYIEPLLIGKLDIGIMRNMPLPDALDYQLLLREPLIAVVHQDHPFTNIAGESITVRQLSDEPFVFFDRKVGTALYDEILFLLKRYNIDPYITQEMDEAMTIVDLMAAGLGVSILPVSFLRIKIDSVRYLTLRELDAKTEVWLVNNRQRALSAIHRMPWYDVTMCSWETSSATISAGQSTCSMIFAPGP